MQIENSVTQNNCLASHSKPPDAKQLQSRCNFQSAQHKHLRFLYYSVADPEGIQGVCSNPTWSPYYFIFMGKFKLGKAKKKKSCVYRNPTDPL